MDSDTSRAWILLAIDDSGSDLKDIIGMADAINHAIPTHSELDDALYWLQAAQLVERAQNQYTKTELGSSLVEKAGRRVGWHKQWHRLASKLAEIVVTDREIGRISPSDVEMAYKEYRGGSA